MFFALFQYHQIFHPLDFLISKMINLQKISRLNTYEPFDYFKF